MDVFFKNLYEIKNIKNIKVINATRPNTTFTIIFSFPYYYVLNYPSLFIRIIIHTFKFLSVV